MPSIPTAEPEEAISYHDLCALMVRFGYDSPDVNVEDHFLQFHLKEGSDNGLPPVVTIDAPTHLIPPRTELGWPRDLIIDFLVTVLGGGSVEGGKRITAILQGSKNH